MNRKGKGYLTIGEISRITGIHPKSIRYYERIGILTPAQVDPETGYRYYSLMQTHHLFAIKSCVYLGIPLRQFPKYFQNGTLHADRYLEDATALSLERIKKLQGKLDYIQTRQDHIRQSDQIMEEKRILQLQQPERTFLVQQIPRDVTDADLFREYADLYAKANELGLSAQFLCGRIAVFIRGQPERIYAALHLAPGSRHSDILTLPAGVYRLLYTESAALFRAPQIFPEPAAGQKMLVLENSCITGRYRPGGPGFILGCIHI